MLRQRSFRNAAAKDYSSCGQASFQYWPYFSNSQRWFSTAATTNDHKFSGLKQRPSVISQLLWIRRQDTAWLGWVSTPGFTGRTHGGGRAVLLSAISEDELIQIVGRLHSVVAGVRSPFPPWPWARDCSQLLETTWLGASHQVSNGGSGRSQLPSCLPSPPASFCPISLSLPFVKAEVIT